MALASLTMIVLPSVLYHAFTSPVGFHASGERGVAGAFIEGRLQTWKMEGLFVLATQWLRREYSVALPALAASLLFGSLLCFIAAATSDPGVLPRHVRKHNF